MQAMNEETVMEDTPAQEQTPEPPPQPQHEPATELPSEAVQQAAPQEDAAPGTASQETAAAQVDIAHVKRVLEAALLSSPEPLGVQQLKRLFGGQVDADNLRKVL